MVRLPGAGGADDPDTLTRPDVEGDVLQHGLTLDVGEAHVLESNETRPTPAASSLGFPGAGRSRGMRIGRHGSRRGNDLGRRVQQPEDTFGGRHRALKDVELLGQIADRPEEALRVLQERDERAEREHVAAVGDDTSAADPQNQRCRQRTDQLDGRVEDRVVDDGLDVGIPVTAIDLVKGLEVALLPQVQLHRRHAGDAFLEIGVDPGDPGANRPVRLACVDAEPVRDRPRSTATRKTQRAPGASPSRSEPP